jgi:signal transduction histidine kinase
MLKTKPKGSGLGLSIVSKILQRHKGEIKVESVLNKYTKFLVTLPINIT